MEAKSGNRFLFYLPVRFAAPFVRGFQLVLGSSERRAEKAQVAFGLSRVLVAEPGCQRAPDGDGSSLLTCPGPAAGPSWWECWDGGVALFNSTRE